MNISGSVHPRCASCCPCRQSGRAKLLKKEASEKFFRRFFKYSFQRLDFQILMNFKSKSKKKCEIKSADARLATKVKPQQPLGCEDFIEEHNAADAFLFCVFLFVYSGNYVVHDRRTDEDRRISTDDDTEDEGHSKTSDDFTAEDCDCKHSDESSERGVHGT